MQFPRLPTRVSSACQRCRRQKQRCDTSRPCHNCVKADRECIDSGSVPQTSDINPAKRARYSTSHPFNAGHPTVDRPSRSPAQGRTLSRHQTSGSSISDTSWCEQHIVVEFGESSSAMDATRRVLQSHMSPRGTPRHTFAIPGGDTQMSVNSGGAQYPIADLIGIDLPPKTTCDILVEVYFYTVHWFSLVVYEPTFRQRYEVITTSGMAARADRPFLILLLMVLAMSCQYGQSFANPNLPDSAKLISLRLRFLGIVRQNFMDFLDEENLEFVQICTLLGSYWLYWGKPRSSFTILGAAVRSAQAISLHRQADWRLTGQNAHAVEERKRVWWTIYTWDRFAAIVYGRPVSIRDKDCDIQMPATFAERLTDLQTTTTADVELSPYQTSLNSIYQIASPVLENIYGIRRTGGSSLHDMAETVKHVREAMQSWRDSLSTSLDMEANPDLHRQSDLHTQMHQLQSLSLQLTYLNLKIIIHRPLLADWSRRRMHGSRRQSVQTEDHIQQEERGYSERQVYDTNFQYCLEAALEISQLERKRPGLVRLASKTHLLSFLAMNIFTSSVVLYICALSHVLSDTAQEAKRGISNNLRLVRSLSGLGSLSSQCGAIIEDLVQIILERERMHILSPPPILEDQDHSPSDDLPPRAWSDNVHDDDGDYHRRPSRGGTPSSSDPQGQRNIRDGTGADSRRPSYFGASTPGGVVSFEQTMEQLQRVLKDASQSRSQQASYHEQSQYTTTSGDQYGNTTSTDASTNSTTAPVWSDATYSGYDQFLPPQDMGQLWLWETGPNSMSDLSGNGSFLYDDPPGH